MSNKIKKYIIVYDKNILEQLAGLNLSGTYSYQKVLVRFK